MPLITGFMALRVVHVAAELGIADLLAEGAKSSEELASKTGAQASTLHRLLRALASLGVIDELEPGRFALNALGAQLRTGLPDSVRNLALMYGSEAWRSWSELRYSVQTGPRRSSMSSGWSSLSASPKTPNRQRYSTKPWPRSRAKSRSKGRVDEDGTACSRCKATTPNIF